MHIQTYWNFLQAKERSHFQHQNQFLTSLSGCLHQIPENKMATITEKLKQKSKVLFLDLRSLHFLYKYKCPFLNFNLPKSYHICVLLPLDYEYEISKTTLG